MSVPKLFITTIILAVAARAAPQWTIPIRPQTYYCPVADSSEETVDEPWQSALTSPGGADVSVSETHTESVTWTMGADLGINIKGLSYGRSVSVSESVGNAFGEGVSVHCPVGEWFCSAIITPAKLRVKGHLMREDNDDGCDTDPLSSFDHPDVFDGQEFEFLAPIKNDAGNAKVSVDVCVCQNRLHWEDSGHPKIICPEGCTLDGSD